MPAPHVTVPDQIRTCSRRLHVASASTLMRTEDVEAAYVAAVWLQRIADGLPTGDDRVWRCPRTARPVDRTPDGQYARTVHPFVQQVLQAVYMWLYVHRDEAVLARECALAWVQTGADDPAFDTRLGV